MQLMRQQSAARVQVGRPRQRRVAAPRRPGKPLTPPALPPAQGARSCAPAKGACAPARIRPPGAPPAPAGARAPATGALTPPPRPPGAGGLRGASRRVGVLPVPRTASGDWDRLTADEIDQWKEYGPKTPLLDTVNYPIHMKNFSVDQLKQLCKEIRSDVVNTVSKTGGHLSSSLGVCELTVALHYVFNTPEDKIIWDVGHQAYVHKILTGRRSRMKTIRQTNGLSGERPAGPRWAPMRGPRGRRGRPRRGSGAAADAGGCGRPAAPPGGPTDAAAAALIAAPPPQRWNTVLRCSDHDFQAGCSVHLPALPTRRRPAASQPASQPSRLCSGRSAAAHTPRARPVAPPPQASPSARSPSTTPSAPATAPPRSRRAWAWPWAATARARRTT
jgi:hypothetical protein